jgi:hypothetical protein
MRQILARVDDELHARLKARAEQLRGAGDAVLDALEWSRGPKG